MGVGAIENFFLGGGFPHRVLDSGSGRVNLRCYSAQNEIARGYSS